MNNMYYNAVDEIVHYNDREARIELVNCPYDKCECVRQLPDINKLLWEAKQQREVKDFKRAIEALKHAFEITFDVKQFSCLKCAGRFRYCIITSMMITRSHLKDIDVKWFNAKRINDSLELATITLREMNNRMHRI